jgi:hypothetical protein
MFAFFAVGIAACSTEGEPGACQNESEGTCVEYGRSQGAAGKRMCGSGKKWIPGDKSCPKPGRLGTCLKEKGSVAAIMYSGPPNNFSSSAAKNTCEWAGGIFQTQTDTPSSSASAPKH